MVRISLAAAFGALVLLATSCSQSEAATISGKYTLDIEPTIAAATKAKPAADADAQKKDDEAMRGMFKKMEFTLNADLTFDSSKEMDMMGKIIKSTTKGTWVVKDGEITLSTTHLDGKEQPSTEKGTIKDGKLVITQDGMSMHLKK